MIEIYDVNLITKQNLKTIFLHPITHIPIFSLNWEGDIFTVRMFLNKYAKDKFKRKPFWLLL